MMLTSRRGGSTMLRFVARASFSTVPPPDQVYDVLISGGGIIGSAMACLLKQAPHLASKKIGLIEPNSPSQRGENPDLRVYTITPFTKRALQEANVWDHVPEEDRVTFEKMQVWDSAGDGFIRFSSSDIKEDHLGYVIENNVLHKALYDKVLLNCTEPTTNTDFEPLKLLQQKVKNFEGPNVEKNGSRLSKIQLENGEELWSRLVIAADGANSLIRTKSSLGTWGWDYNQKAVVATVKTDSLGSGHQTAWQRFLPTGPVAMLPMRDQYSSIVWSCTEGLSQRLLSATPEEFVHELNKAFHSVLSEEAKSSQSPNSFPSVLSTVFHGVGEAANSIMSAAALTDPFVSPPRVVQATGKRASFPLKLNNATSYVSTGVALIGDSAHTIHPLAGQGLNLGFSDAVALKNVINEATANGLDIGSLSTLEKYEQQQKSVNIMTGATMDMFKRMFGQESPSVVQFARNFGMGTLNGIPAIKNEIMRRAMGL